MAVISELMDSRLEPSARLNVILLRALKKINPLLYYRSDLFVSEALAGRRRAMDLLGGRGERGVAYPLGGVLKSHLTARTSSVDGKSYS